MLRKLQKSPDSNWLDTRLLKALVNGSRLSEAENLIKAYREFLSSKKISEILSQFPKSKVKETYVTELYAKFDVSSNITVGELFQHCDPLGDIILNLGKGILRIKDIKKGCLEINLSITQCSFITYKNALQNVQKFCTMHLLSLKISSHPVIYDPWLFDSDEKSTESKIFDEHKGMLNVGCFNNYCKCQHVCT